MKKFNWHLFATILLISGNLFGQITISSDVIEIGFKHHDVAPPNSLEEFSCCPSSTLDCINPYQSYAGKIIDVKVCNPDTYGGNRKEYMEWTITAPDNSITSVNSIDDEIFQIELAYSGTYRFTVIGSYFGNERTTSRIIIVSDSPDCIDPPSGMSAWYPLDNDDSQIPALALYQDIDPGEHHGNTSAINGVVDHARKYNGGYGVIPSTDKINFGNSDYSIDFWVDTYFDWPYGDLEGQLLYKHEANCAKGIGYSVFFKNGALVLRHYDGMPDDITGLTYTDYSTTVPFEMLLGWHLVVITVKAPEIKSVTFNRGTKITQTMPGEVRFYLDGILTDFFPHWRIGSITNNSNLFLAANSEVSPNSLFNGALDEIEFFKRVLTPEEANNLFTAWSGGKCKDFDPILERNQQTRPFNLEEQISDNIIVKITPNPILSHLLIVNIKSPVSKIIKYQISSTDGTNLQDGELELQKGEANFEIPLEYTTEGIYFLTTYTENSLLNSVQFQIIL